MAAVQRQLLQPEQRQRPIPGPERISPASLPPRVTGVPGAGRGPSTRTGSSRFLTSPRCLVRAVSSWPTKQPLVEADPVQLLEAALQQERAF